MLVHRFQKRCVSVPNDNIKSFFTFGMLHDLIIIVLQFIQHKVKISFFIALVSYASLSFSFASFEHVSTPFFVFIFMRVVAVFLLVDPVARLVVAAAADVGNHYKIHV